MNIKNDYLKINKKFSNCTFNRLNRGDYIQLQFFSFDDLKDGSTNYRMKTMLAVLLKKKFRKNNLTLMVSTICKNERVKYRF